MEEGNNPKRQQKHNRFSERWDLWRMQVTGEIFNSPPKLRDVEYKRAIFREGKSFTQNSL